LEKDGFGGARSLERSAGRIVFMPLASAPTNVQQADSGVTKPLILLLDSAGWHTASKLNVPDNITPIFLPSRAPELNPVENVWQYPRQNWLSNTVFENYDAIIEAACVAWRKLTADPQRITSIGMRDGGSVGQRPGPGVPTSAEAKLPTKCPPY
jgi:transposase